jgi:hypothetical protein
MYSELTDYCFTNSIPLFDTFNDRDEKRNLEISFPTHETFYFYKLLNSVQQNHKENLHIQNSTGLNFLVNIFPNHESYENEFLLSLLLQKFPHNFKYFFEFIVKNHSIFETELKSPIHFLIKCSILSSRIDPYAQNYKHFYKDYINIAQELETKDITYKLYSKLTYFFTLNDESFEVFEDILSQPQYTFVNNFLYTLPSVIEKNRIVELFSNFSFTLEQSKMLSLGIWRSYGVWQDNLVKNLNNKSFLSECSETLETLNFKNFYYYLVSFLCNKDIDKIEVSKALSPEEKFYLVLWFNKCNKTEHFHEYFAHFSLESEFLDIIKDIKSLSLINHCEKYSTLNDYIKNFDIDYYKETNFIEDNTFYLPYLINFSKHKSPKHYPYYSKLNHKLFRSSFSFVPSDLNCTD